MSLNFLSLWFIWKCRNKTIFDHSLPDPPQTVRYVTFKLTLLQNYSGFFVCSPSSTPVSSSIDWIPPPCGLLKINCDVA